MTRDEIIEKFPVVTAKEDRTAWLSRDSARKCMDEFAKQQAIEFSDWLIKNAYYPDCNNYGRWRSAVAKYKVTWSTEELHAQFIEKQNSNQP